MAIQGFCPPSPSPPSPSHSPYYQLLERGSARLGRVKKFRGKPKSSVVYIQLSLKGVSALHCEKTPLIFALQSLRLPFHQE